jgi:hypothetical protein
MSTKLLIGVSGMLLPLMATLVLAQDYAVPRTANGRPDLQGVWTNKTLTPLTRPTEFAEIQALSAEQVTRLEGGHQQYLDAEFSNN